MQFRLGSIPVRVHASFFVMAVLLSASGARDPTLIAVCVAVVCVSILAHELGHALMGRAFGLAPSIELYAMGGLTSWSMGKDVSNGRKVLISLAGPAVGLAVTLVLALTRALGVTPDVTLYESLFSSRGHETMAMAITKTVLFVNGWWSIFNLLPMLPLDGGNVTLHTLNGMTKGRGEKPARLISFAVAVMVGIAALAEQQIWIMILSVSFAVQNGRMLGKGSSGVQDDPLRQVLEKAVADLRAGNSRAAIQGAEAVASQASSADLKLDALRLLAYALVADGRWSQLLQLLEGGLVRAFADDDLGRFEAAARESGSREVAETIAGMRAQRVQSGTQFNAG